MSIFSSVDQLLSNLRAGRMLIIVDDEHRENEGDLLIAAEHANAEAINKMSQLGRGLICLTLLPTQCDKLGLRMMTENNRSVHKTAFTHSIEAATGVTTGISAFDRAHTIATAINPQSSADDIVSPGHVFPLKAAQGGVLERAGHTEAGCDFCDLAGLFPAAVICEIMQEDGQMARLPYLQKLAQEHEMAIGSIESLIAYRLHTESLIEQRHEQRLSTQWGEFDFRVFVDKVNGSIHYAWCFGQINAEQPCMSRVMLYPNILDGMLVDSVGRTWPLHQSMQKIVQNGSGILLMLYAEGQSGEDPLSYLVSSATDANAVADRVNKQPKPFRDYGIGAQILHSLGARKLQILGAPNTFPSLSGFGLEVVGEYEQ